MKSIRLPSGRCKAGGTSRSQHRCRTHSCRLRLRWPKLGGLSVDVKERQRELYEAGDYSALAAVFEPAAAALVEAVDVRSGHTVLDVAAGDGNGALAAARLGARVTATDISPVQVQRGQERCARDGGDVDWLVADAERLPFSANAFDRVISAFGVVFAPQPEVAVAELFRVCRPGGIVGLTVWPRDGYMGELTAALREALADDPISRT